MSTQEKKPQYRIPPTAQIVVAGGLCIVMFVGLAAMFSTAKREDDARMPEGPIMDDVVYVTNGYPRGSPFQAASTLPAAPAAFVNRPMPSAPCYIPSAAPVPTRVTQGARTQWNGVSAPPISAQASEPVLIKEFGMEVISAQDAGVKVTGVMGNSHAQAGGLRAGDIITKLGTTDVRGAKQFQQLVSQAPPEADAAVEIIRDGRTRRLSVMVGEGEMEGVTPIVR